MKLWTINGPLPKSLCRTRIPFVAHTFFSTFQCCSSIVGLVIDTLGTALALQIQHSAEPRAVVIIPGTRATTVKERLLIRTLDEGTAHVGIWEELPEIAVKVILPWGTFHTRIYKRKTTTLYLCLGVPEPFHRLGYKNMIKISWHFLTFCRHLTLRFCPF